MPKFIDLINEILKALSPSFADLDARGPHSEDIEDGLAYSSC